MSTFLSVLGKSAIDAWHSRSTQSENELDNLCSALMQAEAALQELKRDLPSEAFGEAIGQCEVGSLSLLLGIPTLCADAGRRILELSTFSLVLEVGPIVVNKQAINDAAWRSGTPLFGFSAALKSFFASHPVANHPPYGINDVLTSFGECCRFVHINPTVWEYARKGMCFSATNTESVVAKELLTRCVRYSIYMVLATNSDITIDSAPALFGLD